MKRLLAAILLAALTPAMSWGVGRSAIEQPQVAASGGGGGAAANNDVVTISSGSQQVGGFNVQTGTIGVKLVFGDGSVQTSAPEKYASIVIATGPGLGATPGFVGGAGNAQDLFTAAFTSVTPNGGIVYARKGLYTWGAIQTGYVGWNQKLICEPGAIFTNSGNFAVMTVSGTVEGCTVIPAGSATTQFFSLFSSSTIKDVTVRDATAMGAGYRVFRAVGVSNVKLQNITSIGNRAATAWALASFKDSKDISIIGGFNSGNANTSDYQYEIMGSTNILFKDIIHLDDAGDAMIAVVGPGVTRGVVVSGCIVESKATTPIGLMYVSAASSGGVVQNSYFNGNGNELSKALSFQDAGAGTGWWTISNNVFYGFGNAAVFLPTNTSFFYMNGNRTTNGVFLSDFGTGHTFRDNLLATNAFETDS